MMVPTQVVQSGNASKPYLGSSHQTFPAAAASVDQAYNSSSAGPGDSTPAPLGSIEIAQDAACSTGEVSAAR